MKKPILISLVVLVIGGSLFFLLRRPGQQAQASAAQTSAAIGETAAEEVARLVGGKGEIAVLTPEVAPEESPGFTAAMTAFEKVSKARGLKIAAEKTVPGGIRMLMMGRKMDASEYEALLRQSPEAKAIVSFAGLPNLSAGQLQQLHARHPLVIVDMFASCNEATLAQLIETRALAMALVSRSPAEMAQEKNQPKLFDRHYKVLRAP